MIVPAVGQRDQVREADPEPCRPLRCEAVPGLRRRLRVVARRGIVRAEEARAAFGHLTELRTVHDWRPAVRLTPWTTETEGHMIVVEPNGNTNAWPVYDQPDLFLRLGNLLEEPVTEIWRRYPYKASHYAKYLGRSIHTASRSPM